MGKPTNLGIPEFSVKSDGTADEDEDRECPL
jgi:hypothetical protein